MLRNRIFTGVAPLIVLLMLVGGYAVWLFFRPGNTVNLLNLVMRGDDGLPPAAIPANQLPRVFEKFHRLPGESREGAGLGLAICREIVRAHDGRIGVASTPGGRGSEFFFVLSTAAGCLSGGDAPARDVS